MIEQSAEVIAVGSEAITLKVDAQSSCQSCQIKGACGHSTLLKMLGAREIDLPTQPNASIQAGDSMVVSIDEAQLLQASFTQFGLPILSMLVCAMIADWVFSGVQAAVIATGLLGLLLGLYAAKIMSKQRFSTAVSLSHLQE